MRILVLTTNVVKWGGSEVLWTNVAESLLDSGHDVMLSIFRHKEIQPRVAELISKGARVHKRPFPSYTYFQPFYSRAFAEVKLRFGLNKTSLDWQKIIKFKPEAVLISSGETYDYVMSYDNFLIQYCIKKSIPYTLLSQFNWEHSMDVETSFRSSHQQLIENANAFLFVSHRNFQMAEIQIAKPIKKAYIVNNPANIKETIPYPTVKKITMAMVARYQSSIKCQANILLALSKLKPNDNVELNLYGSGRDRTYLKSLIAHLGLQDIVTVHQSTNIDSIWKQNQLLILPSLAEGTSLALMECMKAGRSALVTNVGDSALWINNERGYISTSHTVESLRNTLEKAINDHNNWKAKGELCKKFIQKNHRANQASIIADFLVDEKNNLQTPEQYLSQFS